MRTFLLVILLTFYWDLSSAQSAASNIKPTDYSKADSIGQLYSNHPITDLVGLSYKLTKELTTEKEKFRAIFRWVCENVENDYDLYYRNKVKREKWNGNSENLIEWNKKLREKVMRRLIEQRSTVCTGYAYLIRELAQNAGLECEIIDGYGRTLQANIGGEGIPNHSWNAVKLSGEWYLCDATWSSGLVSAESRSFEKEFSEAYYLSSPELFVTNHYPIESKWMLLDSIPDLKAFLNAPLIYRDGLGYGVQTVNPDMFSLEIKKKETVDFRFQSLDGKLSDQLVYLMITVGGRSVEINNEIRELENGFFKFSHQFSYRGVYNVHLMVGDDYCYTYEVNVKK